MIDIDIFTQPGRDDDKVNEDYVCHAELTSGIYVIAVADGMGGLSCGDIAARLTAESIVSFFKDYGDGDMIENIWPQSIGYTNDLIRLECERRKVRMGASVAVAVIKRGICYYSSLGNVRMYVMSNRQLKQIAVDHVTEIAGQSYLKRCVNGRQLRYPVDVGLHSLLPGDGLMIATDGYYAYNNLESEGNQHIVNWDDATLVKIIVE